ncbi:MAG: hypothetical protein NW207_11330 [Cytophagales bacterium]|nr:hypothetical protein [Cytophagales bacterium]
MSELHKKLKTSYISITYDDGMMIGQYNEGVHITLEVAKQIVADRLIFFEGKNYPLLISDKGVVGIDKNARDFLSSAEGIAGISASALVLSSTFSMLLGNFIIKVTRPEIPVKIFRNHNDALAWLRQYRNV